MLHLSGLLITHLLLNITEQSAANNGPDGRQLYCPPAQAIPLQHERAAVPERFSLCSTAHRRLLSMAQV